jgi:hypothetical protein
MIRRETNRDAGAVRLQPFAAEATGALIRPLGAFDWS